jgi:hypothetical protein
MLNYRIKDKHLLDEWTHQQMLNGYDIYSIKGEPPIDVRYDDGDLIINPVNIAFIVNQTGEEYYFEYEPK